MDSVMLRSSRIKTLAPGQFLACLKRSIDQSRNTNDDAEALLQPLLDVFGAECEASARQVVSFAGFQDLLHALLRRSL
jgi:hypothetical protein